MQKTGTGGLDVYLIEYTYAHLRRRCTSKFKQSEAAKHKQHEEMVTKAIQGAGYKCTLLVLQVGVSCEGGSTATIPRQYGQARD